MSTRTIAAIVILLGILVAVNYDKKEATAPVPQPVVCTQDAKQCPDGSYVGRSGPQCQFAPCPITKTPTPTPTPVLTGTVKGVVSLSPACGIQADPPIPGCDFRAYETKISFIGSSKTYTAMSDSNGNYSITLPAGSYTVQAQGGNTYPSCAADTVVVKSKQTVSKDIVCNSGLL